MSAANQKKINFATKVLALFSEAQKNVSIHKTLIFQLVKYSQEDVQLFKYSFEQAYLKIFHSFHTKVNKKIPNKFQGLAESFFEAILPKPHELEDNFAENQNPQWHDIFNAFLNLCSQGTYSSIMNIRIMCSRLLFILLKLIPPKKMENYLSEHTQDSLMNSILYLLRTKVSTYRQLGIKLSSLVIHLRGQKINAIQKQLFKIMAIEENQQIRKLVITNLTITKDNLEQILIRLRDKNPEIRVIVAKKLQGEKFKLDNMNITHLYKLLYDGYGSKQILVKKQCLRYFSMYFLESQNSDNTIDIENKQKEFVNIFRPEILLLNPHLYCLFDELIADLLEQIQAHMADYIRSSCSDIKNNSLTQQIIWLKNASSSQSRQISRIYEEFGPSGLDLSNILKNLTQKNEIFGIYQLLQLFNRQKMPDQIGRNKMYDALKALLVGLKEAPVVPNYESLKDNDICHKLTQQQITRKKLMLSYYDMPIISTSFDLIFQIGQTMKQLRPQHYQNEMKQVMAEWNSPDDNLLRKQRELVEMNIERLRLSGEQKMHDKMKIKHSEILQELEQQHEKTRKILMCISRLRHNCNLESFMSLIKDQLEKQDKANGLLLLGLYCLENQEKVNSFWHIFWKYIEKEDPTGVNKNHLLVSLKIIIDFIVKFNCLSGSLHLEQMEDFSPDSFLHQMLILLLHGDPDIRILAIQSLCRLIYHQRIDKQNESIYFFYLFLLWLEAPNNGTNATKTVHTVSIFIKSYLQKGNRYSLRFSEVACLFLKVLAKFHSEDKCINKQMIKYNLTMEQFFKKVTFTFLTICKYHKQNRSVIWAYNSQESEMGPQQFLLLYMLQEDIIVPMLGKALSQCDFYQFCGLETLILIKKILQKITESRKWKGVIQSGLKKLQSEIQINIASKNAQMFNDQAVESMEIECSQKMKLLQEEERYIHRNIDDLGIFVKTSDESDESSPDLSSEDVEEEENDQQSVQKNSEVEISRKKLNPIERLSNSSSQKQNSELLMKKKKEQLQKVRQKTVNQRIMNLRNRRN